MLNPEEMIQAVLNIEDSITHIFGVLNPQQKDSILSVVNKIADQLSEDTKTTTKYSGYEPDYFGLMVETFKQNKQLYIFNDETIDKVSDYLSKYNEFYYESVDDCMPMNIVGKISGNEIFINTFIDNNFGFFNEI